MMDGSTTSNSNGLANNLIPSVLLWFDFKCGKCLKEINLHSTEQQAKTYRMAQFVLCRCISCNSWNNLHYMVQNYTPTGPNPYTFPAKDGHTITVYHCFGAPKKEFFSTYPSTSTSYINVSTSPQAHSMNEPPQYSYQSQLSQDSQLPPFPMFHNNSNYNYYNYYSQNSQPTSSTSNYSSSNQQMSTYTSNEDLILRVEKENTIGQLKLKARDYGIKHSGGKLNSAIYDVIGKNKHDLAAAIVMFETSSSSNPALIMSQMANSTTSNTNGVSAPQASSTYGISNGYFSNSSSYPTSSYSNQTTSYSNSNYSSNTADNSPPYVPPTQVNQGPSMKRSTLVMENGNSSYDNQSKKQRTSTSSTASHEDHSPLSAISNLVSSQTASTQPEHDQSLPLSGQIS